MTAPKRSAKAQPRAAASPPAAEEMAQSVVWEVIPSPSQAKQIAQRCRRKVTQRALFAAGVAMVPVPGLDWLTDVGVLVKLLPEINEAFGLSPEQVERLAPDRRIVVYKALSAGSSMLVGKLVTREVVMMLLKLVGVRLTTQQAAKYVPVAGQAVSAALTFSALKYVCELHIRQCVAICEQAHGDAPPASAPVVWVEEAAQSPVLKRLR
jgi:uncharacterized protein (DUF697 family)